MPMLKYDLGLKNASIINWDGEISKNLNIAIEDNKIIYLGDKDIRAEEEIDCKGKLVSPTFVNCHSHSPMNILKGIAEDVSISDWFNKMIWPYESKFTEEYVFIGSMIGMLEMIDNGISILADHYFFEETIIEAAEKTGIRLDMAPTIFGGEDFQDRILTTRQLVEKYKNHPSIEISFGPHSTYLCSKEELEIIASHGREINIKSHIHIGEEAGQIIDHKNKYGESPLETLDKVGLLDQRLILAHNLHYLENDVSLLRDENYVALSPKTYGKLAMDPSTILKDIDKVNWVLATDGAASSNSLSIVEQLRLLALMGKKENQDATKFDLKSLWQATMKGHEIFKFNSGRIEEGKAADLIIWDLNTINCIPNYNFLASIIYSSESKNIDTVIINGAIKKRKGKLLVDMEELIGKANNIKKKILEEGKGRNILNY